MKFLFRVVPLGLAAATTCSLLFSGFIRHFSNGEDISQSSKINTEEMARTGAVVNNETGTIYLQVKPPFVVNTWPFTGATQAASSVLSKNGTALDAVETGVNWCELHQCDGTVGFGGSPAEDGSVFLDAMIIDGESQRTGAVLNLPNVKRAISVARGVMERTTHTLLTGEAAGNFAAEMQYSVDPNRLRTPASDAMWQKWKENNCQPNYRRNVLPDPAHNCGPYKPTATVDINKTRKQDGHDTIGMIAFDAEGRMAIGTSTNGMKYKVPGRVADSAIPGSGGYADKGVGGAVATGDGDVIVAYAPAAIALDRVSSLGLRPDKAAASSLSRLLSYGAPSQAAMVVATPNGQIGAACIGFSTFTISYWDRVSKTVQTTAVKCPHPTPT